MLKNTTTNISKKKDNNNIVKVMDFDTLSSEQRDSSDTYSHIYLGTGKVTSSSTSST
jgi:hypothetical protein